jgi:predicted nucleic acid-binding protein
MNAVDTNILLYAHDPRDPFKQTEAKRLIASLTDGVLLWQVACEFVAASRKLTAFGFTPTRAWHELNRLRVSWDVKVPSWQVMTRAESLLAHYKLSFWDAMIVAACLEAGVTHLYSEDFDNQAAATGLIVINPFII